ncbi:MAG: hypothetical protein JW958_14455 [Candidatus Eisenbacteria bacterium]|nr:hypothetical protein [Candidatus Eisenbacteria bacterium]
MAKITVEDLIRMVRKELGPSTRLGDVDDGLAGVADEADWEMLCRLAELWRVHNPKLRGDGVSHRRLLGLPVRIVKRAFRILFQPFINEILDRQTVFNQNMVRLADLQRDVLLSMRRRTETDREELEGRLERLEKELSPPPAEATGDPGSSARRGVGN